MLDIGNVRLARQRLILVVQIVKARVVIRSMNRRVALNVDIGAADRDRLATMAMADGAPQH